MFMQLTQFRLAKLLGSTLLFINFCGGENASAQQRVQRLGEIPQPRSGQATLPGADYASNEPNRDFDDEIDRHFKKERLPGLVVVYARDGMLTYKSCKGFADVENQIPMSETSVSRLNSVSKLVGSIVLLRLEEQQKINLKHKARDILTDLPQHHSYRVIDLLTCRSGVRHYGDPTSGESTDNWSEQDFEKATDAISNFWNDPLASPVGAYHYSTFGYSISDACAEKVTGKSFRELLQTYVSNPTGASTLRVEDLETPVAKRVKYYTPLHVRNGVVTPPKKEWTPSGGGMESSALDLLKVGIALGDGKLISKQNLKRMMNRVDPLESYGIGCSHATENGYEVMAKSGAAEGSNAYIWLVPERRMVMVILTNRDGADVQGLGNKLRQIALGFPSASGEKADLVVNNFERTAPVVHKNGQVEFPVKFKVTNNGKAGINLQFVNAIKVEGVVRWTGFMDPMPREGYENVTALVKIPDPNKLLAGRELNVEVVADAPIAGGDTSISPNGRVNEESESNNRATLSASVPGGLDLAGPAKPQTQGRPSKGLQLKEPQATGQQTKEPQAKGTQRTLPSSREEASPSKPTPTRTGPAIPGRRNQGDAPSSRNR
jgi:CubicO group peptidase (beta-lactamase class C family)